ncbi:hypothetical protein [Halochromatium salexigens]|uniref:Uncharacterized protein n=1 Tax=Halochromatium salexigens TaxID=49447 RepID=A0AAJ0XF91_HALSE|nr:hypothetical protein [Halochromatium salexigens]MBK5930058.1 hypothetical protein [Halochromatium salexigens]
MTTAPPSDPIEPRDERLRQWHRLFGIALMEVFEGAPWRVELEQELALRSQLLDVAIIEARGEGAAQRPLELPDGLENLRPHNLLTYKSQHEALTAWTLDELIGYYVNTAWEGVYELPWGGQPVRLIVLNAIAKHPRNAPWELFASEQDRIQQGLIHYRARHPHLSQGQHWELLERLHLIYQRENLDMAYTMEDFLRETHELVLANMTPEERLKGLDPDEVLQRYDPEERLKGLDPATIEAWLAKQRRDH